MVNLMLNKIVCDIKVSLIKSDSFQVLIVLSKDRLEFFTCFSILAEIRFEKENVWAELFPYEAREARSDPKLSCNVISSHDHVLLSNRYGFFDQYRVVTHFDGCIESIHVNMNPGALEIKLAFNFFYFPLNLCFNPFPNSLVLPDMFHALLIPFAFLLDLGQLLFLAFVEF
jgi:hypothetical protein